MGTYVVILQMIFYWLRLHGHKRGYTPDDFTLAEALWAQMWSYSR